MEMGSSRTFGAAAYGGDGWDQRTKRHFEEIGELWAGCGQNTEWAPLREVLLHRPGPELVSSTDFNAALQLGPIDLPKAQSEHDLLTEAYEKAGVVVHHLERDLPARPNQMF